MAPSLSLSAVALLCVAFTSVAAGPLELTDQTFSQVLDASSGKQYFVKFYAPWCGHCKRAEPEVERLADALHGDEESNVVVARLDASKYTALARRYGVRGFPTFKLFSAPDGKVLDYSGGRTASAFSSWIRRANPAADGAAIPTDSAGDEAQAREATDGAARAGATAGGRNVVPLTDRNFEHDTQAATGATTGTWFVAFVAPWCGHCKNLHPTWDALADELKGSVNVARVDATLQKRTAQRFGVRAFPTIKLLHKGRVFDYGGARDLASLKAFALGGFKSEGEGDPVPAPVVTGSVTGEALAEALGLRELQEDLTAMASQHLGGTIVLAAAAFTSGLLVMLGIAICTIPAPHAHDRSPARQGQYSAPPPPPPSAGGEPEGDEGDEGDEGKEDK